MTSQIFARGIQYHRLPEHMRDGARRWVENGLMTGDFMTAVMENDLMEAFGRADEKNRAAMFDWSCWLYNQAPRGSYGSVDNVRSWRGRGGLFGPCTGTPPEEPDDENDRCEFCHVDWKVHPVQEVRDG